MRGKVSKCEIRPTGWRFLLELIVSGREQVTRDIYADDESERTIPG